jgi:hypothetical protein
MPFSDMTAQIADFHALTSIPGPKEFHGAHSDCAIRLGWLSGIGLGGIEEFRTLPRWERSDGI